MALQNVYLDRLFPDRLDEIQLAKLPVHRLKAYYNKHRRIIGFAEDGVIQYSDADLKYNSEFNTDAKRQVSAYFDSIKKLIAAGQS